MAKKKTRYPNRNRNIIIGVASVLLLVAAFLGISALNTFRTGYIFKHEGKRVPVREYYLYLFNERINYEYAYGADIWTYATADYSFYQMAQENALDSLINTKIVLSKADEYGVVATDEDKAEAAEVGEQFVANVESSYSTGFLAAMQTTQAQLNQVMLESMLVDKIYTEMTKDFTPDEADLQLQYDTYLDEKKTEYMTVNVNYIQIADLALAKDLETQLDAGGDFDALMVEHSTAYDAEAEDPMATTDLAYIGISADELAAALAMQPGDISDFQAITDGYVIYRIESIEDPDYDDLSQRFRDSYINTKKQEVYVAKCDEWREAANVEIYQNVFNNTLIPGVAKPTPAPATE